MYTYLYHAEVRQVCVRVRACACVKRPIDYHALTYHLQGFLITNAVRFAFALDVCEINSGPQQKLEMSFQLMFMSFQPYYLVHWEVKAHNAGTRTERLSIDMSCRM
jgi:hypothetical protein